MQRSMHKARPHQRGDGSNRGNAFNVSQLSGSAFLFLTASLSLHFASFRAVFLGFWVVTSLVYGRRPFLGPGIMC